MKRRDWKKTAAFVTSVAMATSMMPAELGSIIVHADVTGNVEAERSKFDWSATFYDGIKTYLTSIKVDGVAQTNLTSNTDMNILAGSKVEFTSSVPLNIIFDKNIELKLQEFSAFDGYEYQSAGDHQGEFKKGADANVQYVSAESVKYALLEAAGYDITGDTFTQWAEGQDGWTHTPEVVGEAAAEDILSVHFTPKETKNSDGTYTYSFVMPDDNKEGVDTVAVSVIPRAIEPIFFKSEADRTHKDQNNYDAPIPWDASEDLDTNETKDVVDYFADLVITSRKPATKSTFTAVTQIVDGKWSTGANAQVVGDTITVTAKNPFAVHVNNKDNTVGWINPTTTFDSTLGDKGLYKATFTMPDYVDPSAAGKVEIDIVKIDENYTYTVSGSKLLATSDTGAIKNAEAASIVAKYYEKADDYDAAKWCKADDKGTVITGAIPNGKYIVVGTTDSEKLATFKSVTITKDGSSEAIALDTNDAAGINKVGLGAAANDAAGKAKAGTYKVTYVATGKDGRDYIITNSFTVNAKGALSAENVKLGLTAKKDNAEINEAALDAIMYSATENVSVSESEASVFMLEKGKAEDVNNANYQFTITPTITDNEGNPLTKNVDYYEQGFASGSKLGNTYELMIYVTNPEYGGSVAKPKEIKVQWKVVDYDEIPHWENNRFGNDVVLDDARASIENLSEADLKAEIFRAANANDAAKALLTTDSKDLKFQWIAAPGANRTFEVQDELDNWDEKLPNKIGKYTVYVVYKDVVQATVDLQISNYSVNVFADESDLTYTYGKKFELKKPTILKNIDGNTVNVEIDNLTCTVYKAKATENGGYEKDGVALINNQPVENQPVENVGQLNAGKYLVSFSAHSQNDDYTVIPATQLLTVNTKSLDDPSIVILIDPFAYNGETQDVVKDRADNKSNFTVRDTDFEEDDPRYDISDLFKITEGDKQSSVGAHDCTFTLVSDVNAATGRGLAALAKQKVIKEITDLGNDATLEQVKTLLRGLNFDELSMCGNFSSYVKTTLPGRIVVEDSVYKFVASNGDKIAGEEGVEALVTELTNANNYAEDGAVGSVGDASCYDRYARIRRKELIGNFKGKTIESNWHITALVKPAEDADAGLKWDNLKSTLYDNGRLHLEITRNASDKINKDKTVADIVKFGVVIDKEGKLPAPSKYGVTYNDTEINNIVNAGDKAAAQAEKTKAEKFLQVGNGFTEGGYTKTSSPVTCASQTYKVNISVKDAETGVWARPYVQYADGTVSYGDVKYLDLTHEAIERLGLWTAGVDDAKDQKAVRKADLDKYETQTVQKIKDNVKSGYNVADNKFYVYTRYTDLDSTGFTGVAQVADFGVVIDKNGAIDPVDVGYANADPATKAEVDKALRIGATNGLVVGHYKKDNPVLKDNEYAASIKLGNEATGCWVRSYVDLGNGLVIYNDPIYIKSASDYYGQPCAGYLRAKLDETDANQKRIVLGYSNTSTANTTTEYGTDISKIRLSAVAAKAGVNIADVKIVQEGVVADKNNLLVKENKMVLGAGFIEGKKTDKFNDAYSAKISPKDTNDISIRSYTIYDIKGVKVTVYGSVKTFEYSEKLGKVVWERTFDDNNVETTEAQNLEQAEF